MPALRRQTPKYRLHKATGQAVVTISGRDLYLGPWQSKASKLEYDRLVGEWLAAGRPNGSAQANDLTITELVALYWKFCKTHYLKGGKPTSELALIRTALRYLRQQYGTTLAREFGPLALKAVREAILMSQLARSTINAYVMRIRRMFRWATAEEHVPVTVYQALATLPGLKKGRTPARESVPVRPVEDVHVDATMSYLSKVVADMIRFQRLTGARPGDVCHVRPCDIDRSGEVWRYTPATHKTEHHGAQRIICIGPKAQAVLLPYLLRAAESYCFSPAESAQQQRDARHAARKTPLRHGNSPGTNRKARPKRQPRVRFDVDSYRRAITRAVLRLNAERKTKGEPPIPSWSPNRLRHTAATEIRQRFGIEAAQVALGHANADVTQVYAERNLMLAADVARQLG